MSALDARDYAFPPEFVAPKAKEKNSYGLAYAKAIFNMGTRYGGGRFYNSDQEFDALTELAQGRQSVSDLRKIFGYHDTAAVDNTKELAFIDPRVLNLATKYVNRAVAKMQRITYDIGLECIDIVSINEKEDYAAAVEAFYRLKDWHKKMGLDVREMITDIDLQGLPDTPDEMMYDATVNPKIKKEISGELFLKLIHAINRMDQKWRQLSWDLVTYGRCHVHCFADNNGYPRAVRINPKFWEGSYIEDDDFEEQEYAMVYDFITTSQFIKETSGEMTYEEQMRVVQAYSFKSSIGNHVDYKRVESYDGLGYIPVARFYFRSEDNRTYVETENSLGREILIEKGLDYVPPIDKKARKITNTYTSIYGGTWVVDSDIVYNYKRQEYPRMELVDATIPIKTFTTNYREGRCVSFLSQMAEPLFMINAAWNKIKQILAEGRMGVMEIDFNQIEDVAMGSGGKKWTPQDVLRFLFKKNILVKRGRVNQYEQKVQNAIEMNTGGLQLSDYFTAFTTGIQMLEQMTASSALEQAEIPDRLAAKNALMSAQMADMDMEYLYNARENMIQRVSHQMLLIGQGSLQNNKTIQGYIPALGKVNTGFYKAPGDIAYCEYGMFMERQAGPEEKAAFLMDVSLAVKEGRISVADSAYVRNIDNLKQAQQILALKEQQYERKQSAMMQENQKMQMEMASAAAADKMEADMTLMDKDGSIKAELIKLKGQMDQLVAQQKGMDSKEIKQIENQMKRDNAQRSGEDAIMRESVRNIPYKGKTSIDAARLALEERKLAQEDRKLDQEDERIAIERAKPKTPAKK